MAKKAALYADAERLYVNDQLTLEAIASKLGCGVRTLTNWKAEGNWDSKRQGFIELETSLHGDLYRLAQLLTRKNLSSIEAGEAVDARAMSVAFRAIAVVKNTVEYEDSEVTQKQKEPKRGLSEETIRQIEEEVLGLRRQ
ncbi:MAG: hypothetical protein WCK32_00830 [Chlorobiaceae bacterium]